MSLKQHGGVDQLGEPFVQRARGADDHPVVEYPPASRPGARDNPGLVRAAVSQGAAASARRGACLAVNPSTSPATLTADLAALHPGPDNSDDSEDSGSPWLAASSSASSSSSPRSPASGPNRTSDSCARWT